MQLSWNQTCSGRTKPKPGWQILARSLHSLFFFSHFSFRTTTALWCTAARWTTPSWSVSSLSSTASPSGSSSWCSASPPPRRELSSSHTSSGLRRSVHRCFYQHRKAQLGSPTCGNVHFIMKGFRGISMLLCLLRCYHPPPLLRPSDESYLMLHKGLFTNLRALKNDINYAWEQHLNYFF